MSFKLDSLKPDCSKVVDDDNLLLILKQLGYHHKYRLGQNGLQSLLHQVPWVDKVIIAFCLLINKYLSLTFKEFCIFLFFKFNSNFVHIIFYRVFSIYAEYFLPISRLVEYQIRPFYNIALYGFIFSRKSRITSQLLARLQGRYSA